VAEWLGASLAKVDHAGSNPVPGSIFLTAIPLTGGTTANWGPRPNPRGVCRVWLNAPDFKSGEGVTAPPGVRIPHPPPLRFR
jgi:hypothetical protein